VFKKRHRETEKVYFEIIYSLLTLKLFIVYVNFWFFQ